VRHDLQRLWPPAARGVETGLDPIEVHTLVCADDVGMSIWSLLSFIAATGLRPRVVVHDDGSLDSASRARYQRAFHGIEVLDAAKMDSQASAELERWPACKEARGWRGFYCARKLFDILWTSRSSHALVIDSDVLFFQRPDALLECVQNSRPCFADDIDGLYYSAPRSELAAWLGRDVLARVNAGILHVPMQEYRARMDLLERYFTVAQDRFPHADTNRHEQTCHALLMSELGGERLPSEYQIGGPLGPETAACHFVDDPRQRERFYREGVPRVRRLVRRALGSPTSPCDGTLRLRASDSPRSPWRRH
jgi:hypothetical protein